MQGPVLASHGPRLSLQRACRPQSAATSRPVCRELPRPVMSCQLESACCGHALCTESVAQSFVVADHSGMQAWRLSRALASLRTAEALCKRSADAHLLQQGCAVAQQQLLSSSWQPIHTRGWGFQSPQACGFRTTSSLFSSQPGSKRALEFTVNSSGTLESCCLPVQACCLVEAGDRHLVLLQGRGMWLAAAAQARLMISAPTRTSCADSCWTQLWSTWWVLPAARQCVLRSDTELESMPPVQKEHGWSDKALQAGAASLKLSPAVIGTLQRGPAELIEVTMGP